MSLTDRWERNKLRRRPRKTGTDKRRRVNTQKRRLAALGVSEEKIAKLNTKELRTMLKYPVKLKKKLAKA
jgi:hypothetical protein